MGKITRALEQILSHPRAKRLSEDVPQELREIAIDLDSRARGRGRPRGSSEHMARDFKLLFDAAARHSNGWPANEAFELALSKATPSNSPRATRVRVRGRLFELDSTRDPLGRGRLSRPAFVRFAAALGIKIPSE